MARYGRTTFERFCEAFKVAASGCWEWQKYRQKMGYGIFRLGDRSELAHHISWALFCGTLPTGDLCVLHSCDNSRCVNPVHLFIGTRVDNNADMVAKGRQRGAPGIRNGSAKLTETDVRVIRIAYEDGETQQTLADRFGVHQGTVSMIVTGKKWVHV